MRHLRRPPSRSYKECQRHYHRQLLELPLRQLDILSFIQGVDSEWTVRALGLGPWTLSVKSLQPPTPTSTPMPTPTLRAKFEAGGVQRENKASTQGDAGEVEDCVGWIQTFFNQMVAAELGEVVASLEEEGVANKGAVELKIFREDLCRPGWCIRAGLALAVGRKGDIFGVVREQD
eukprot:scaffold23400_cov72-Skeletonema_dohrnii-CCMP3373.AAC.1